MSNPENPKPDAPEGPPSTGRSPNPEPPPAGTGSAEEPQIPRETPRDQRNRYSGGRAGNT